MIIITTIISMTMTIGIIIPLKLTTIMVIIMVKIMISLLSSHLLFYFVTIDGRLGKQLTFLQNNNISHKKY